MQLNTYPDPLPTPTCPYWTACNLLDKGGGCCALGMYDGKPHLIACNRCQYNATPQQISIWHEADGKPVTPPMPVGTPKAAGDCGCSRAMRQPKDQNQG